MKTIEIIVETPKGSTQKFDYDPGAKFFQLTKILPAGMSFPYDFGFIPNTKGEDGDPLDVMVISDTGTFAGCRMTCRIIGAIKAEQTERQKRKKTRNDRFIAIPVVSVMYEPIVDLKDLPMEILVQLQQFFINYNEIAGKKFKPIGISNAAAAMKSIMHNKNINGREQARGNS